MKCMILDGNSIANRAFFGIRMLNAPDGTPTNAVYGFLAILNRLLDEYHPEALCVSFDVHAPTFRHKANEDYKAQRKPMPEELRVQMPILKDVLQKMNIRIYEKEGYEADDILGTVGRICEEKGWECIIVTGDKDSLQLITEKTSVCHIKTRMGNTETILYTPELFQSEYGFPPLGMIDLKSLMGDSSDNIPGVPGIGEKTAMDLVQRYHSLDEIYRQLETLDVKEGVRKKLREGEASARESYWLATIFRFVPMEFEPSENLFALPKTSSELYESMQRLGFYRFLEKWGVSPEEDQPAEEKREALTALELDDASAPDALQAIAQADLLAVESDDNLSYLDFCDGKKVYRANRLMCFAFFDELLSAVFSPEKRKTAHNVKNLQRALLSGGLSADGFVFDTALAAYLLSATDSDYELLRLSRQYLGRDAEGVEAVYLLTPVLQEKLTEQGMKELFDSAELPLCRVLAEMELAGFLVDKKALSQFGEELSASIEVLHDQIIAEAGMDFNINSPKQLGELLFEKLQLPYGKKTKTGWSTSAEVLEKLRGVAPIVDDILEYRMLTKLKSTYADGLLKVISSDGRVHTSFQMTVTATGRLSSTEPNLQNIPIRKQVGSQIRKMFVAAPGNVLVDADYSQIELRLLAHIADDAAMQEAFLSGEDFHTVTAAKVFNLPVEEVTPNIRSRAKAVNFGIIYGMSAFSLSQDIHVSQKEAKAYMDAYFARFPGVRHYMDSIVENARQNGYVSTLYGRRRALPELKSSNFALRQFGERVALNMPIQGTAADIIKLAMIAVDRRLKEAGGKAKLLLQVHDELIVECPEEEKEAVEKILKESMEQVASLKVPLLAEVGSGLNWAEAH